MALRAEKYANMAALAPYKGLYAIFVVITTAIGIMGIRAIINLVKRKPNAYMFTIITLILGVVTGAVRMGVSQALRGKSMPVDMIVYTTALTLVIFLLFRIPSIWEKVDFAEGNGNKSDSAGGAAAIMMGLLTLTIHIWIGSSHTWGGVNYADAFSNFMIIAGAAQIVFGAGIMMRYIIKVPKLRLLRPPAAPARTCRSQ